MFYVKYSADSCKDFTLGLCTTVRQNVFEYFGFITRWSSETIAVYTVDTLYKENSPHSRFECLSVIVAMYYLHFERFENEEYLLE